MVLKLEKGCDCVKKRRTRILLLLALFVCLAGCANQSPEPETTAQTVAIGNPWTQWASMEEAEAAVGFSFGLPEVIADHYTAEACRTLNDQLLEVIYRDGDFEVRVRKQKGENQDISGDYNQYDTCTEYPFGSGTLTNYHNSGSDAVKQVISCNGYSWSLTAPNGYWGDSNADFLNRILEQ